MRISHFQTKQIGENTIFSANFLFRNQFLPKKIWIEVPTAVAPRYFPEDSFLCMAYPLAVQMGEDLYFDGTASDLLISNLPRLLKEIGINKPSITIFPKQKQQRKILSENTGQFFTLGVDSFYTLLDLQEKNALKNHTLLYCFGYDVLDVSQSLIESIRREIGATAKHFSAEAIFLRSNIRELSEPILHWGVYHGAALAAIAHTFPERFGTMYFNSSSIHQEGIAWGTNFYADALWSTEALACKSYGTDLHRVKKIEYLSHHSEFSFLEKRLRVCWENLGKKNAGYNCSRCEKCIRTHLAFALAGQRSLTVFNQLDLKHLKSFDIKQQDKYHWRALYQLSLERLGAESDISQALRDLLIANSISLS